MNKFIAVFIVAVLGVSFWAYANQRALELKYNQQNQEWQRECKTSAQNTYNNYLQPTLVESRQELSELAITLKSCASLYPVK